VRRLWTVRFRVTALATLVMAAVLVAAGAGLVLRQERVLTEDLEDGLRRQAGALGALAEAGDLPARLALSGDDDSVAQVVAADGSVLAASPGAGDTPLADPPGSGQASALQTLDGVGGEDEPYRALSTTGAGPDGPVVVHVASPLDDIEESTATLLASLTVVVPAAALVLAALTWWLVGRALRPVEAIRAEVADIGGGGLDRRVPVPPGHDEGARLARTMNDMLAPVEGSAHRQQQFVADASHELRSPLTRMRSELEVDLAHPATADLVATHHSVLEETEGLQRLVEDLLQLAGSAAGGAAHRAEPTDLDALVAREAERARETAGATVVTSGVEPASVVGDPPALARVLRNLLDNAVRHAASRVDVGLATADGHAVLSVADDGPGIPADQRSRVFERFARVDEARSAGGGGTGLGLAIARDIVERHGGTIAVDPGHDPGTKVVVRLPSRPT